MTRRVIPFAGPFAIAEAIHGCALAKTDAVGGPFAARKYAYTPFPRTMRIDRVRVSDRRP